jgi:hypothetical protein
MENAEKFMGYSGMLKGDTGRSKENTRESTRVTRRFGRDTGVSGKTREDPRRAIREIHRKYRRSILGDLRRDSLRDVFCPVILLEERCLNKPNVKVVMTNIVIKIHIQIIRR